MVGVASGPDGLDQTPVLGEVARADPRLGVVGIRDKHLAQRVRQHEVRRAHHQLPFVVDVRGSDHHHRLACVLRLDDFHDVVKGLQDQWVARLHEDSPVHQCVACRMVGCDVIIKTRLLMGVDGVVMDGGGGSGGGW